MNPIAKLVNEHVNILKGISLLESGVNKMDAGDIVAPVSFRQIIDFIRNYADRYHHAKEEDILFKKMGKAGFPMDQGPVAVMLMEHDEGRGYVAGMEKATEKYAEGDESAIEAIIENARGYIFLLRQHIDKEDNILYPMAENILGPAGIEAMKPDFEKVEADKEGTEEKYLQLLKDLESQLGTGN